MASPTPRRFPFDDDDRPSGSVRPLSPADLQAILAHLSDDPDQLLAGTGADRPVVAVRVRATVGWPGGSAQARWRRLRAAELAAWTRTLPWRAAVILGIGAGGGVLGSVLAPRLGLVVAGLAAVAAGWGLRFRPSPDAVAWRRGAAGERRTARLLAPLERHGWAVLHDLAVPGSRANIDHLVIGSGGVFVIDSKQYRGRLQLDPSKPVISLEGSAWAASATNIAPARRLRYALLVPRLVAPHRNTGFGTAIDPEQAVALLAQGRVRDLFILVDKHSAVPSLDEAASSRDWRWRFVAALGRLLIDNDRSAVTASIDDAPNPACRAAACVVTACALMDAERHVEAATLLSEQPDDASPIDWAWIQTQLARTRAEIGEVATARQDAAAALRALVGDPDDVTASAIRAAAAQLLFQTAQWGDQQLEELITKTDTAVSWWRTQTLASALTAAADRNFRQWADEQGTRIDFEDTVNNRLFAAVVSAHLTGEQGAWRTTGSLLARDTLIVQHAEGDTSRQTEALNELRRSGDEKSLELAASRLWAIGPLDSLAEATRRIQPDSWTHTTARANLVLWQEAGDVLDEATASDAARYCLDVLTDDSDFVARTTPPFHIAHYTLKALAGLLDAADDTLHRDLAAFLASLPPITDELTIKSLVHVVPRLRATALPPSEGRAAWRQAATSQPNRRLTAAMLGLLAKDDNKARKLLLGRVGEGDNDALAALGDLGRLDIEVADRLMAQDAQLLDISIAQAQAGAFAISRTRDPAARLVILGVHFPDVAPWDALLGYLRHDRP